MKYVYDPILKKFRAKDDYMGPETTPELRMCKLTLEEYSQLEVYEDNVIYFILNEARDKITGMYVGTIPFVLSADYGVFGQSIFGNVIYA